MGISRHIEMQDVTPVVADDEKAVQNTNCQFTTVRGVIKLIVGERYIETENSR